MTKAYPIHIKRLLYNALMVLDRTDYDAIKAELFPDFSEYTITIHYLKILRNRLRLLSYDRQVAWRERPTIRSGRPRAIDAIERDAIITMISDNNQLRLNKLTNDYIACFYGENIEGEGASYSTIRRVLLDANLTRKVLARQHEARSEELRREYYDLVAWINPFYFIDIDECGHSQKEFFEKYGWSPCNEDAILMQIKLNNITYNVIAAYCPLGFIAWDIIVDKSVTQVEFQNFLNYRIRPIVTENTVIILDNCALHKTVDSLALLELITNGRFQFCAPYSPMDKPIERGFSLIKNFLRRNEREASLDPILWINKAFSLYGIGGELAHNCFHHWDGYFKNHQYNQDQMNI